SPTASTPRDGMWLKLKRSEKQSRMGSLIYVLDARMDVSPDVREKITKYGLGELVVYESSRRQAHKEAVQEHLQGSGNQTSIFAPAGEQAKAAAKSFWKLGRAAVSAGMAALSLRITVNSMLQGVHVECKDMGELLEAEEAISEAAHNVRAYLETAETFSGQEKVID